MNATAIAPFKRHVHVANMKTHGGSTVRCFVTIEWKEGGNLSICGVEGPRRSGNCYGSCGQTRDMKGWVSVGPDLKKLQAIWKKWHLNDMKAGTPAQTAVMKKFFRDEKRLDKGYTAQLEYLREHDLETDNGYKYGTAWLRVEVPTEVVEWLRDLKGGPSVYPWNT